MCDILTAVFLMVLVFLDIMLCHSIKWRHYSPLKSLEILTQWQRIMSLGFESPWWFYSRTFFSVLTFHTLKSSVRRLIEIPCRGEGRSFKVFELPTFIELCHLNKMLVKANFMNKSIICLKISHLPGSYEMCWSSCSHKRAPQMCCIYSVWKVHIKWECGQMSKCGCE